MAMIAQQPVEQIPVRECMSVSLVTCAPFDTLGRTFQLMSANHIRRLPVVEDKHLVGIVTWSDALALRQPDPAGRVELKSVIDDLSRLTVSAVMTRDLRTVYPEQPVGHAAEIMLEEKIGGLPVLDADGRLVGLITESNIFRMIAKRWREANRRFSGARGP